MITGSRSVSRLRRIMGTLLAMVLAVGLAACGADSREAAEASAPATSGDGSWPRTIATDDGELTLDSRPQTIVSTSVTLTGSLLAVNAPVVASGATGANVEGTSDENGFFVQWSDVAAEKGVEKLYENSSPQVERVAEYEPDLIVVAATGGDSALEHVDQLREVAPVLVLDYGSRSWQDVTTVLGEATGHEEDAAAVIADYEAHLAEVQRSITIPEGDTSAFIVFGDGTEGVAALTDVSPQVQILQELGFAMAEIPEEVKGNVTMGEREDIVELSAENVQRGLTGDNWVVVAADSTSRAAIANNPTFNTAAPVTGGKVVYTPASTFRIDYYSALEMLDALREAYGGA